MNAIHAPSMDHDLTLSFTMRDIDVAIHEAPQIHCEDPIVDNHSVSFDHSNLCIPLQLNGLISPFHTRSPTEIKLNECEKLFVTPRSSD